MSPGDDRSRESRERLRRSYLRNVVRAVDAYLESDGVGRVRADRAGERLVLTFVLDEPEAFQRYLEQLNGDHDHEEAD